jgi:adenylate cyclase
MHPHLQAEIGDWIITHSLAGDTDEAIVAGVCTRLAAAGLPMLRVAVTSDLLDPTDDARGVRWRRDEGAVEETYARVPDDAANEQWLLSPFFRLIETRAASLRRRLDASYRRGEFPLLDTLQEQGGTDYVAFVCRVGKGTRLGDMEGVIASWATDAPGGYREADLALLAAIMRPLALAFMLASAQRTARTIVATYLGDAAASRILSGNIVRGRAEPLHAVVWFSDLVGFTRLSAAMRPEDVLALLNEYAEVQVEAIEGNAGHVLKFMGDGILAIFPDDDPARACARALDAATVQAERLAALNERRSAAALPVTGAHVALHIGELLYGNVGSPRRLDFTVLGPAVNEVARIEALCSSLDQAVIVSSAFAAAAGAARARLVSLGRYAMKGVARPQEMYTLDPGLG